MKKPKESPEEELQKSFDQWKDLCANGCNDPSWSDGVNINLVRNHIIYYKHQIEEAHPDGNFPAVYYRDTPPEVDQDYMARPEEIRKHAKETLAIFRADKDLKFLKSQVDRLRPADSNKLNVRTIINYAKGLELATEEEDLIAMRRYGHPGTYLSSFSRCAQQVRELKAPDNEQLSLFYSYGNTDEPDDEEDEGFTLNM